MDCMSHKQRPSDNCICTARKSYKCQNEYWIAHISVSLFVVFFFQFHSRTSFRILSLLRLLDCVKILSFIFALKTANLDCEHKHHSWPSHGRWVINNHYWLHHLIQVHTFCSLIEWTVRTIYGFWIPTVVSNTRKWVIILPYVPGGDSQKWYLLLFTQRIEKNWNTNGLFYAS